MTLDDTRFEDRLRLGMRAAVTGLRAPDALDGATVERRIARRSRRRVAERTAAGAVVVALAGGLVAVVDRASDAPDRSVHAGAPTPRTGAPGWATIAEAPLAPRFQHTMVWTGTEALVLGGYEATDPFDGRPAGPEVAAYDPATGTWRVAADFPGGGPDGPVAGGVWTGADALVLDSAGALFSYEPGSDSWAEVAHSPWGSASTAVTGMVWTGTGLVVVNGATDGDGVADVTAAAYDPAADVWRVLDDAPFTYSFGQIAWTGEQVVVVADTVPSEPSRATGVLVAVLDPVAGSWTTLDVPLVEADRRMGTFAYWTGSELVVGGGAAQTDEGVALSDRLAGTEPGETTAEERAVLAARPLLDVAAWEPRAGTWRTLADSPFPLIWDDRYAIASTGARALLWATDEGPGGSTATARPVLYDPVAGDVADPGPGAGRLHRDAPVVWTGHEFLVWSGEPTVGDTDQLGCCVPTPLGETLTP